MSSAPSVKGPDSPVRRFFLRTDVVLFLATLLLRLLALPFAQSVDADDVTRVLFSLEWLENPYFIQCEVWPTLHYYLIALFIAIFNDHIFAPLLINILLCALITPLLYHFTRKLYDHEGAVFAAIVFMFVPIFFRLSLEVMSEIPFLLLLMLAMLYLLKGIQEETAQWKAGLIAGLCIALSSGFRLEGWLVTPLLLFIVVVRRKWLLGFTFSLASVTYPLFWMSTCFLSTSDPLFSIHMSAEWNHSVGGINDIMTGVIRMHRVWIQPMTLFLMISPWLLGLLFTAMVRGWQRKIFTFRQYIWLTPLVVLFILYEYKIYVGDMNVHPRYGATLMLFMIPHFGLTSFVFKGKWLRVFIVIGALGTFVMSFFYRNLPTAQLFGLHRDTYHAMNMMNSNQFQKEQAVPVLRNKRILTYESVIAAELKNSDGLILDFLEWESTYHMMLHSGVQKKRMLILIGDVLKKTYNNSLVPPFMENYPSGILMLKHGSGAKANSDIDELNHTVLFDQSALLKTEKIFEDEQVVIFKYRLLEILSGNSTSHHD